MKTLITILLFMSLTIKGQFIQFWYVTPGVLCPCDSITVMFKYNNHPGQSQFNMACSTNNQIWQFNNNHFYSLPKVLAGTDTVYTIKLKTPCWWPMGFSTISPDWVTTIPLYFYCASVGIQENKLNEIVPIYFDLDGKQTPLISNKILIEQKGNTRTKIINIE